MAIKPLADRVVAKKDAAVEQTASGILLGEAKEKQNTAANLSAQMLRTSKKAIASSTANTQLLKLNWIVKNISSSKKKIFLQLYKLSYFILAREQI